MIENSKGKNNFGDMFINKGIGVLSYSKIIIELCVCTDGEIRYSAIFVSKRDSSNSFDEKAYLNIKLRIEL